MKNWLLLLRYGTNFSKCYYCFRKRQREQEIQQEESAKKKKEWDKKWEVQKTKFFSLFFKVQE